MCTETAERMAGNATIDKILSLTLMIDVLNRKMVYAMLRVEVQRIADATWKHESNEPAVGVSYSKEKFELRLLLILYPRRQKFQRPGDRKSNIVFIKRLLIGP